MKLHERTCTHVSGPSLETDAANALINELESGWKIDKESNTLSCDFQFKNFYETMAFVNAVAWIANQQDHHPDLEVGYKHCHIHYTTHSVNGLSENDFICAAKIDRLAKQ